MAFVHVTKIKNKLEQEYSELYLQLKDRHPKQEEVSLLSKLLAAHALVFVGGIEKADLFRHITDGPNDRGIDGAYYSPELHRLTLVQSKWSESGKGSLISEAGVSEFANGIQEIITQSLPEQANEYIQNLKPEFQAALDDFDLEIKIVVISTAEAQIGDLPMARVCKLIEFLGGDEASPEILNQSEVYKSFNHSQYGPGVSFELALHQVQSLGDPFQAWYGYVTGLDIAELIEKHGDNLMARNLRGRLGDTEINDEILETALNAPENFWYFNNGLTIIADDLSRSVEGGRTPAYGRFKLNNGSIVNGAQTSSTLAKLLETEEGRNALANVKCLVRLIELPKDDKLISRQVTRYNNSQNGVGAKDFVALETFQKELQREIDQKFARNYYVRSGAREKADESRDFDLQEATVALVLCRTKLAKRGSSEEWNLDAVERC